MKIWQGPLAVGLAAHLSFDPGGRILRCARRQDAGGGELEEDFPHCDPAERLSLAPVQQGSIDVGLSPSWRCRATTAPAWRLPGK